MEIYVSLLRNLLCVFKSLLHEENSVMKRVYMAHAEYQSGPISQLEGAIGILQLAGSAFNLCKGISNITGGLSNRGRINRRVAAVLQQSGAKGTGKGKHLLKQLVEDEAAQNTRRILVGVCQTAIGGGFVCLALFSWKFVEVFRVIWTLVVLELALLVLLYLGARSLTKAWRLSRLVDDLPSQPPVPDDWDLLSHLASGAGLQWESIKGGSSDLSSSQSVEKEAARLESWAKEVVKVTPAGSPAAKEELRRRAALDAVLLMLNVVAFVGYATIPLTFFYPEETAFVEALPWWPGHDALAFTGNLAADAAWTVEPAL
ncbi:unnamed protein product, partial [Chrysoparadoxa australica]